MLLQRSSVLFIALQSSLLSLAIFQCCDKTHLAERYSSFLSRARADATLREMRLRRSLMVTAHLSKVIIVVRMQGKAILRLPSVVIATAENQVTSVSDDTIGTITL